MQSDQYGQPVRLSDKAARSAWDGVMHGVLSHGAATPQHLAACLEADPDFALGHAAKGLFLVLLGRRELLAPARAALDTARSVATDPRSRAYVAALDACLAGRMSLGAQHLTDWLDTAPDDALAVKLDHSLRFVLGDAAGMRAALDRTADAYGDDHPATGYVLGCRAFALEETGSYADATRAGRAALERAGDDAWGLHAVAHVHDMTADAAGGIRWLAGREDAWAHCNNFRYHVWWHKALMLLDLGRADEVLALYDAQIRADRTDDYRDISNAASLLQRLDLDGVDVGTRWAELADLAEARTEDGCLIFADLHYLLALMGDDRAEAARRMVARIAADAGRDDDIGRRMARPGISAAEGLEAFGEGRFGAAFAHLRASRPDMQAAGGSHAQRDVFERLTIDAGIRAGQWDAALRLIDDRSRRRGGTEDGYAAARREMISQAREDAASIPAE